MTSDGQQQLQIITPNPLSNLHFKTFTWQFLETKTKNEEYDGKNFRKILIYLLPHPTAALLAILHVEALLHISTEVS